MIKQTFIIKIETGMGVNPNEIEEEIYRNLINLGYDPSAKVEVDEVTLLFKQLESTLKKMFENESV